MKAWNKVKELVGKVRTDGLLHILCSSLIVLAFTPIVGVWWSILIGVVAGIAKEAYDLVSAEAMDFNDSVHDLICDLVGIVSALLVVGLWYLVNL